LEEGREFLLGKGTEGKGKKTDLKPRKSSAFSYLSEKSDLYYTEDSLLSVSLNPEREIIQSEKRYFETLRTLHNEFLAPLFNNEILPRDKRQFFTKDLNMIYNFHRTFLTELRTSDNIPQLFIQRADFFKIYINYVENYTLILDSLREFRNNEKFINFTKKLMGKNLYIESLLITPIQRIPRYELLLKEMLKNSNLGKSDQENLIKARDKVHEVAGKLNERQREFENLTRLSYIASRIHGRDDLRKLLYQSQRKFLDEQEMKRRSKWDDSKLKPCWTLLFSDILITTDLSYKFKREVKLHGIVLIKLVREFKGMIFKIENENDLHLFCHDFDTAEEWQQKILMNRDLLRSRAWSRLSQLSKGSQSSLGSPTQTKKQADIEFKNETLHLPLREDGGLLPIFPTSSSGFSHLNVKPEPRRVTSHNSSQYGLIARVAPVEKSDSGYDDYDL